MSMTLSSRRELYKLRELAHFLLFDRPCFFCEKPLVDQSFIAHGNSIGPKFTEKISIHHIDGNHENNEHTNKAPCHTTCHKSFHRRIANEERALRNALKKEGK